VDPLTHTATGLLLARAGLHRLTPRATPILLLAANAPDIDVVTAVGGPLSYLHFHRHLTHSLIAMPLLSIAAILLVRLMARTPLRWAGAFWAALAGVASHLLLDFTNAYGIRLFLPFSESWLRLDLTPVVDVWIWTALLIALTGPLLARLVVSEITSGKPQTGHGRGFAWAALLFLLFYNGGRAALHARAVAVLDSRLYNGAAPARVAAMPSQNPLVWRGLVETGEFDAVEAVDLAGPFDPSQGQIFYKPVLNQSTPDSVLDAARRTKAFETFLEFSQFPFWRITAGTDSDNTKHVEVFDMRFGSPSDPGLRITALVNAQGRVISTDFQLGPPRSR
jgi:inner membrane protein